MSGFLEIKDSCTGCGICVKTCPVQALSINDNKRAVVSDACTLCSICVDSCPFQSLAVHHSFGGNEEQLAKYSGILVLCEMRNGSPDRSTYELLGEARKLSAGEKEVSVLVVADDPSDAPEKLIHAGADRVIVAEHSSFEHFSTEPWSSVLTHVITEYMPEIVLAAATTTGRDVMPRVSKILDTGLTADCTELKIDADSGMLMQTRPAFGGNIMATIVCDRTRPQMSTVRPGVMKPMEIDTSRTGEVINLQVTEEMTNNRSKVLEFVPSAGDEVDITEAEIVISGGRGMKNPENFSILHDLAHLLGGTVGASRAAVDNGWIEYPRQVGQTGKTVQPKTYLAAGISGAVQHRVGMQSSDTIYAVNKDRDANIFQFCTEGFVGDLFDIIPALVKEIEKRRG
ncbi:MAG: electron transfer flavoprotein subunit alpha [Candidatus Fermentibacteraceae bacterium]|nr:electron transfer flavoprotein subunit alpha [Candidatus Fermentibacteraceae bacterium]